MIKFLFLLICFSPSVVHAQLFSLPEVIFEQKIPKKEINEVCSDYKTRMDLLANPDVYLKTQLKVEEYKILTELEKDIAILTIVEDFAQELKEKEIDVASKSLKCTTIKDDGTHASLPDLCIFLMAIQNHRKELALRQENLVIYTFNKHNEFSDFEKAHYLKKIQTWNDQDKLIERKK
jgi:hypothetical protein